jgi:hypothetical protein
MVADVAFVLCLGVALNACAKAGPPVSQGLEPASNPSPATEKPKKSLSQIDLSKIGHMAPKGRVQDKDYNDLEIVDQLIANGKDSIPYLISKLDDETVIHQPLRDFWPELTIGDVALFILSDFSLDSTWKKRTIPGTNWQELFGTKKNSHQPAWEYYYDQMKKHNRRWIKAKWQKIWTTYKDRIVWDEQERCFKVA